MISRACRPLPMAVLVALIAVVLFAGAAAAAPKSAPWIARHGLTPAAYQQAFDDYAKQGFRLINVSGYVQGSSVRYAALWHKVQGPPWAARHGLTSAQYQQAFDEHAKKGFRLTWVNGFETPSGVRYAAVWEKKGGPAWTARHGLTSAQYQQAFNDLTQKGYRLLHVSGYTHGGAPRFAAIFEKTGGPQWLAHHNLSGAQYQQKFEEYAKKGFRVKVVSGYRSGGKNLYAAIWEKRGGRPWLGRHGIPASRYQRLFEVDYYRGYRPTYVEGFSSTSPAFNTVWESLISAADRQALDAAIDGFLPKHDVAGLSVAIAKDGRLLYAAGHGLADRESNVAMDVHHRLRIGSISKSVTSVAIFRLIESGATFGGQPVTLGRTVFGPGGILAGVVTVPNSLQALEGATIQHFLEHTSGLPGANSGNNLPDAVNCAAGNLSKRIEFVLENNVNALLGPPGTMFDYSNFGYTVLERVIEVVSGTSYETYVRNQVWSALGLTAPRLFRIGPYVAASGEAKHYLTNGNYAEYAAANTCENEPPGVGAGGWATSARDLLRFLASVDGTGSELLPGNRRTTMLTASGPNPNYGKGWILNWWAWCQVSRTIEQGHNGGLAGGFSNLFLLDDGFSFAVLGNQNTGTGTCSDAATTACGGQNQPACSDDSVGRLLGVLTSVDWPGYDLF